jgi:hypothetical protein
MAAGELLGAMPVQWSLTTYLDHLKIRLEPLPTIANSAERNA